MSRQASGGSEFGDGRHRVRYDRDESEPPSVAAATAVAEYRGEDVHDASVRLYEYVDPEALDALFANRYDGCRRGDGEVRFTVGSAMVVVRPDRVHVYPTD